MTARSLSGRFQPTGRPDCAACGPLTTAVQLWALSSIHCPAASFLTIRPTAGGTGLAPFCAGTNEDPELGGGFGTGFGGLLYGLAALPTTFGGKTSVPPVEPPPRIVEPLPDSNIAAYT